jgi:hypothetical protein
MVIIMLTIFNLLNSSFEKFNSERFKSSVSQANKIIDYALPIIGFSLCGFFIDRLFNFQGVSAQIISPQTSNISSDISSIFYQVHPLIPLQDPFIDVKTITPSFISFSTSSLPALSLESFLASPIYAVNKKIFYHAVGDALRMSQFEGGNPLLMSEYFLAVLEAKLDSLKLCNLAEKDAFCLQHAGTHYKELKKKLTLAKEIYVHFYSDNPLEFSAYLKDKFSTLQANESLFFSGGWRGHGVIYELIKQTDSKLTFRVYNTGEGSEIHPHALIGLKTLYLPFIERKNIDMDHFCGIENISLLQALIKEQFMPASFFSIQNPPLNAADFHRVLATMEGDVSERVYDEKEMRSTQQSGTCSYMSLLAAFTQNLKDQNQAERFAFEAELKALHDYDRLENKNYVSDSQAFDLAQKGKTLFAIRVEKWKIKGIISKEELPIILKVLHRVEANLNTANKIKHQQAIQNFPKYSLVPKPDASLHFKELGYQSCIVKEENINLEAFKGSKVTFPAIQKWQVNPKNLVADLQKIQSQIELIKADQLFTVAQEIIKQVALKLPFHDSNFWKNMDKSQAKELIETYANFGEDLTNLIIKESRKYNYPVAGYLKPSDYLALLKFLWGADQTIRECKEELGFSIPSIYQERMNDLFYNNLKNFPLAEAEWHQEFNRLHAYWKEQKKEKKLIQFQNPQDDFFYSNNRNEWPTSTQLKDYTYGIQELNWAIEYLKNHPELLPKQLEENSQIQSHDFLLRILNTIRPIKIGSQNIILPEQSVLPNEFYLLRRLAFLTGRIIKIVKHPHFWPEDALNSVLQGSPIIEINNREDDTFKWIRGIIDSSTVKETNLVAGTFEESLGSFSNIDPLYEDILKHHRISPNIVAYLTPTQFERNIKGLFSEVPLQIDQTLGFFVTHIGELNKQVAQNVFEYSMFDAGLLLKEMTAPIDSQLLVDKLSNFCTKGFKLFLKQDLSTAHFFLNR